MCPSGDWISCIQCTGTSIFSSFPISTDNSSVFHNKLDSEVNPVARNAKFEDIQKTFIPALTALVKAARAKTLSISDVHQATRALVDLNTYFEGPRHWASVWTSDAVKNAWRNLWLSETLPNTKPPSEWFETELPTLGHLDAAMDLWFRCKCLYIPRLNKADTARFVYLLHPRSRRNPSSLPSLSSQCLCIIWCRL